MRKKPRRGRLLRKRFEKPTSGSAAPSCWNTGRRGSCETGRCVNWRG